jgi:hypothetical protein
LAVDVRSAGISAGVQLDFCPNGVANHARMPSLAIGDTLTFIFLNNERLSGTVFSPDADKGIIEVSGVCLSIRRAMAADMERR